MALRQDVNDCLRAFKAAMDFGYFSVMDRQKNSQGLMDLGLTPQQRKDILGQLEVAHYYRGPSPDDTDPEREVWEFGYDLEGTEIYIKLRLVPIKGKKTVKQAQVWSFHKAEFAIKHPLREGG